MVDLLAGAVALFVAVVQRGQRVGDRLRRHLRLSQQSGERLRGQIVAKLAERFRDDRPQQLVAEQRHEA